MKSLIQDNRQLFEKIIDSAPNAMIIANESGEIHFVNHAAEKLFGYERQELVTMKVESLIPERYRGGHGGHRKSFFADPKPRPMGAGRDLYGLRKDRSEFPIEIGLNPLETGDQVYVLASIIDITERKTREESLQRFHQLFEKIIESAPNAMIIANESGEIHFVNHAAEKLFGYERQELVTMKVESLIPERYRGGHGGHRKSFFADPKPRPMGAGRDLYGLRKDKSEFPIEIGLNPLETSDQVYVLASIIDITERKTREVDSHRFQEQLERQVKERTEDLNRQRIAAWNIMDDLKEAKVKAQEAEERFRMIVEGVEDYGIFLLDPQGYVATWNKGAEKFKGYKEDEIIGKHYSVFYLYGDQKSDKPAKVLEIARNKGTFNEDGLRVRKNGTTYWARVLITALRDANGVLRGYSKITQDITEFKKDQERIQYLSNYQKAILENAGHAIISMDINGIVQVFNPMAEHMLGYKAQEMVEQLNITVIHDRLEIIDRAKKLSLQLNKQVLPGFEALICNVQENVSNTSEWTYLRKDGSKIPVLLTISALRDESKKIYGYLAIASDISNLKKIQSDLMLITERFNLAKTSAQIGVWDWDLVNNTLNWDKEMFSLYQIPGDKLELGYHSWQKCLYPEDLLRVDQEIQQALRGARNFDTEFRIIWPDRSIHYIKASAVVIRDYQGQPQRMIGTNWDITQSKTLEIALRDQKWAIDQHSIVAITDVSGKITYANDKFCEISKYSRKELLGQDHRVLNSGYHPKEFMREMWRTIASGQVWKGEVRNRAKDGSFYWVDVTIVPFLNSVGKPYQYFAIRSDITARKIAEEELVKAMNVKGEFISIVSHELRTPLTVIKESVAIVYDQTAGPINADQKDFLETAKRNVDRLARLINDVLDYQKIDANRMEFHMMETDINDIVREVGKEFQIPIQNKGLVLEINFMANLPKVMLDRDRIIQVLDNLMSNAFKFTHRGRIILTTELKNGKEIQVSVIDQGGGIKTEDIPKLFKSFSQISTGMTRQTGGTGLGLALCKKIIEHHNGQVGVESKWGEGSTFYFTLPVADGNDKG